MEEDGLIIRKSYLEITHRVEYELSEIRNSLRPIIKSMEVWGNEYKKEKNIQIVLLFLYFNFLINLSLIIISHYSLIS